MAQLQLVAGQLPSCDGAVFLTNNLHQLRTTLSLYPVLPPSSHLILDSSNVCTQVPAERLSSLQDLMTASLAVVSRHQTQHLVSALGLLPLAPLVQPGGHTDGTPLSTVGTELGCLLISKNFINK